MSENKECFVISPIGPEGSEDRERADKLMEHIIGEAVSEFDYTPIRADNIAEPGSITNQVITKTVESELVIADLTNHNPNVFYELAVRHASAEPYIQLIDSAQSIPFDIAGLRTIKYDFDVSSAEQARQDIVAHIKTIEEGDLDFDTPISRAADFNSLRQSDDPTQETLADILSGINQLNNRVDQIEEHIASRPGLWKSASSPSITLPPGSTESIKIPEEAKEQLLRNAEEMDSTEDVSFEDGS